MKQSAGELSGRIIAAGTIVVLGQAGLAGCGAGGPDYSSCAGVLGDFSGDHSAGVTNDHSTWNSMVLATTKLPKGPLVVGYADSHAANRAYTYSKPVAASRAGTLALKIGPGDVSFIVQYAAKQDSRLCHTAPLTTFSRERPLKSLPPDAVYPAWPH